MIQFYITLKGGEKMLRLDEVAMPGGKKYLYTVNGGNCCGGGCDGTAGDSCGGGCSDDQDRPGDPSGSFICL